ncbi:MAG TPA: hopanoid biosynthesis-associated protein HpnK [Candidatus Limnocylindria bacterium]|nr:hopanoid biosynthesis-associated protein HpnK [Candidatus Limnocylindria bacterium]
MAVDDQIRLIVNADDFGISRSANSAIRKAHLEGILTSASLMVNGDRVDEAVAIAKANPLLGVGVHLTLVSGTSTLKPSEIIGVVNQKFEFDQSPVRAGIRYYFSRSLHHYIRQEINAQIRLFKTYDLPIDHLNGHLNFHLHPTVFEFIKRDVGELGVRAVRMTRDPLFQNLGLAGGRYFYRLSHALIFNILSARSRKPLERRGFFCTDATYGLLQSGHITERYLLKLLAKLKPGTYELYAHPDEGKHRHELEALTSPKVKKLIRDRGIILCRYSDFEND